MRISLRSVLVSAGLIATVGAVSGSASAGGPTVSVLLLREHGVGTSTTIQPYLDQIVSTAAQLDGWDPASKGKYFGKRGQQVDDWIKTENPHYGIFSLAPFLAMRKQYNLEPVGSATLNGGGGQQYFIVSMNQGSLGDCKGKTLVTDHNDTTFNERIVADGAFKMSDFTVVNVTRTNEAGDKVVNGAAECALVDDAQLATVQKSTPTIKVAWTSNTLPPMVVAAFPSAPDAEKATFKANLSKICSTTTTCSAVGLQSLTDTPASTYQGVIGKYP